MEIKKVINSRGEILESKYSVVEFNPIIREDVLDRFKVTCKDEYQEFLELFSIFAELDVFLESKRDEKDSTSKIYYTRLMHIKVKDHFTSSIILISQGFLVDSISLVRSALEDLFVILNFYIEPGYFESWLKNGDDFKIRPYKLRNHKKINQMDKDLFNNVYEALCKIVHPRINSISHMVKFHPTVENSGTIGIERLKRDTQLINLSFFVYLHQLCNLMRDNYSALDDKTLLDTLTSKLWDVIRKNNFIINDVLSNKE